MAERIKKLTDGRKPVTRSLPPIAEACAAFKGFTEGGSRSEQVFEILSTVIQRVDLAAGVIEIEWDLDY